MTEELVRDGVELIVANLSKFLSDLGLAQKAQESYSGAQQKVSDSANSMATSMSNAVSKGVSAMTVAMGNLLSEGIERVIDGFGRLITAGKQWVTEGFAEIGSAQEQELIMMAVGRAMGYSKEQLIDQAQAIEGLGMHYDTASSIMTEFMRMNIDTTKSLQLAAMAQNMAAVGNTNIQDAVEKLDLAIRTGETRYIRRMGIFVDLKKIQDDLVDSMYGMDEAEIGLAVQQARINAILAAGAPIADAYAASLEAPSKRMELLRTILLPEIKEQLAAPFLSAWSIAAKAVWDFYKAIEGAITEGGALYPILVQLGAVASIVADGFSSALGWVTNWITGLKIDMGGGFADIAESALNWGANVVTSLAEGIVSAASGVLAWAMDFIGGLLSSWLGPGSPPKVAPEIPDWGRAAMSEYVKGMTDVDLSLLKSVMDPFSQVMDPKKFAGFYREMAKGLSAGTLDTGLLDRMAASSSAFGKEIADLARMQGALAEATAKSAKADEDLKKAQDNLEKSGERVADETTKYNEMLRKGADDKSLKAQLARINAAEKARDLAVEEVTGKENAAEQAKKAMEEQKKQVGTQQQMVNTLLEIEKLYGDIAKEEKAEADRKAKELEAAKQKLAGEELALPTPTPASWNIKSSLTQAVDDAKIALKAKFGEIWDNLKSTFGGRWQAIKDQLLGLGGPFTAFWETISRTWTEKILPALIGVRDAIEPLKAGFGEWWTTNGPTVQAVLLTIWEVVKDLADAFMLVMREDVFPALVAAWGNFVQALETAGVHLPTLGTFIRLLAEGVGALLIAGIGILAGILNGVAMALQGITEAMTHFTVAWGSIGEWIVTQLLLWGNFLGAILNGGNVFTAVWELIKGTWENAANLLTGVWQMIAGQFTLWSGTILGLVGGFIQGVIDFFTKLYNDLVGESIIPEMLDAIYNCFVTGFTNITSWMGSQAQAWIDAGVNLMQGFWDGLKARWTDVKNWFEKAVSPVADWFKRKLGGGGEEMPQEPEQELTPTPEPTVNPTTPRPNLPTPIPGEPGYSILGGLGSAAFGNRFTPAFAGSQAMINYSRPVMKSVNVTIGPVSIQNSMDAASFNVAVEQAVKRALRNG